ncbi:MAG TPA: translocation/assembly module TamB domain-containing protein, partial [Flavisolibacter sp.]|nr:translocation/assembly module TamB domain-containing protein [Flavisolibacter sp.]
ILLKTVLFLFLFVVLLFLLILTPPVQRFLTGKVETYLQNKLKTEVEIGSISFGLSGNINLENVYIEDRTKDTLVSGGVIKAHLNFLKLFSNEVQVKDLELRNITAKIKRVLPDTVFNFQFIADAFATQSATPDTAQTAPMKLDISGIVLSNINLTFTDVITGNDMFARIGNLSATFDTLDTYNQHFDIPSIIARNVQARIKQSKPLLTPEPLAKDIADAAAPSAMKLNLGTIDLSRISVQYDNDVSALYSTVSIGQLRTTERLLDLQNNRIYLDTVSLNNSKIAIRLGKTQAARVVEEEVEQEVKAQQAVGWDIRVAGLGLDNNTIRFDNDNSPRLGYGLDYAHIAADSLSLHLSDFVMNKDSIGVIVNRGRVREKSGLVLQELRGNLLYANTRSHLTDLYIKTPGTEIKRSAVLEYASYDALMNDFGSAVLDIELVDSRVQVKDILLFAPQLRSNPALSNPNDTWYLNIVGNGTLDRLNVESLRFDGLSNTQLNAKGTLVGLSNPQRAGGNFTIYNFHTTQTDIALFTGQRLSNAQMNLPEEFDLNGTIIGNAGSLNAALNLNSSAGAASINGRFSNLTSPSGLAYNARLRTRGVRIGSILRQPDQFGSLSGDFTFNGKGITPQAMDARFTGNITSFGYNRYQYRNIRLNGSLRRSVFDVTADINDPNADLNLTASGSLSDNPTYRIEGMIDSVKAMPLNFATQPLVFRGRIEGSAANVMADNPDIDLLITNALLVSNNDRLPLDTVQLIAGRTDTANFIQFNSDIANARISGKYRLADLGSIIQSSIQPYFSVTPPAATPQLPPYDFDFTAEVVYRPILSTFVPGLTRMETIKAQGNFVTGGGMNATLTTPYMLFNGNEITDLNLRANTADSGLQVNGNIAHIKSGNLDLYNTRLNATALNNNINFSLGVDDRNARNLYFLSGLVTQPSQGTYAIRLRPDSLLLNAEPWTVTPDNLITITPDAITANNFVLQHDGQSLSINSIPGPDQPLQVNFTEFRVATITGFINSDSILVDGVISGNVVLSNIMQQPVFTSDLTIRDLSMRKDTLGNVSLQVSTGAGNRYNTNLTLSGRGNDLALTGFFSPSGNDLNLDLNLVVRQLQLSTLEGPSAGAITNASGGLNGNVRIGGTASDPSVQGSLNFDQASFALSMLGSQFRIDNESLSVTENGLIFDDFTIRDSVNNTLDIDGTILTSNFINYNLDLDVDAENFQVLNSTKAQNNLYYGQMNITSNIHIGGTEKLPIVDGSVTVNDGTNFFIVIPQAEPGVQQREGVVQFVDFDSPENDSLFLAYDSLNTSSVLGMDLAVNIDIRKEANFNVIVDPTNGDFLNIRGEGVLSTGIDPSGKITMVGTYSIEEGAYQISFNFLQRRFNIEKGSTITWTGEPTTAQVDVTAVYLANTAPLDLVANQISGSETVRNTYLQKLPFEVHLNVAGELMRPVITFDIRLPDDQNYGVSNDIVTAVQARLDQIRQDEGEINKQVFSLLLLGRFVGENPFESNGAGFSAGSYARQSVSKLLTEQLNQLAGGLIGGVDLNFDVQSSDDFTTGQRENRTDLNVGLSKRLLNDRLKITVGSNFQLEGPQNTNQRSNNIAGNIAADYQLSKDGRYLLRFYRRNEYEGVVDGYIIETGIGFILSVDYNRFSQIFRNRQPRRQGSDSTNQNPSGR